MKNNKSVCPFCLHQKQKILGKYKKKIKCNLDQRSPFHNVSLLECRKCKLVYASPLPNKAKLNKFYSYSQYWKNKKINPRIQKLNKLYDIYPALNYRIWRAIRSFSYLKEKTKTLNKTAKVLSIGSGFAPFLFICKKNGIKNTDSLEPSLPITKLLSKEGINNFSESIEFFLTRKSAKKYDLIILSHIIEHLRNPFWVLEKIKQKLSNKGILYIEVPYRDDLNYQILEGHIFFFNKKSLKTILLKQGYKVHKLKYFWSPQKLAEKLRQEKNIFSSLAKRLKEKDVLIFAKEKTLHIVKRDEWRKYLHLKNYKKLSIALSTNDLGAICSIK